MKLPTRLDGLTAILLMGALYMVIVSGAMLRVRFDDWRIRRAMIEECRSHPIRPATIAPTRSQSHVANGAVWVCPTHPGEQWHVRIDRARFGAAR